MESGADARGDVQMSNIDPAGEWDDPDAAGASGGDKSVGTSAAVIGLLLMGGGTAMSATVTWMLLTAGEMVAIVTGGVGLLVTLGLLLLALYFAVEVVT